MANRKYIFLKTLAILLIILMIYFCLGFLACITLIFLEANNHQMSIDIGDDFNSAIIYWSLGLFSILLGGMIAACYVGYYYLNKTVKKLKNG